MLTPAILDATTPRAMHRIRAGEGIGCRPVVIAWALTSDVHVACDPGDGGAPDGGITGQGPVVRLTIAAPHETQSLVECVDARAGAVCRDAFARAVPCANDAALRATGDPTNCEAAVIAERVDAPLAGTVFVTWGLSDESGPATVLP